MEQFLTGTVSGLVYSSKPVMTLSCFNALSWQIQQFRSCFQCKLSVLAWWWQPLEKSESLVGCLSCLY